MISKKLGSHFSYDFIDVIKINPLIVEPFDLKNKSLIFTSVNAVQSFFANGFKPDEDFTSKKYNKIYTVGITTKRELRKYGYGNFLNSLSTAVQKKNFCISAEILRSMY